MKDKNNITIQSGDIVKIENAYFKNDNGYWLVEQDGTNPAYLSTTDDLTLVKVGKTGKVSTAKYNIAFYPLRSYCNDRSKKAAANEHNAKNATIEIVFDIDNLPSIAYFEQEIRKNQDQLYNYQMCGYGEAWTKPCIDTITYRMKNIMHMREELTETKSEEKPTKEITKATETTKTEKKTEEPAEAKEDQKTSKYYPINEELARRAHEMMSFSNYREGSKTKEYQSQVDDAYEIADEAAKARPEECEKIYYYADKYARKLAENYNHDSAIGTRCASVLIAGGSNFPVKKKQKQVAAWDSCHKEYNEIQQILEKIRSIARGKNIIKSGEENAIEKLQSKLERLKKEQERMKAANKAIRLKDTEKGNKQLFEMGYTQEEINKLRTSDFIGRVGYPSYLLQNNNANIHRIEERIKTITATKENGTTEKDNGLYKVVENTEIMRLQLFFDGKPDADTRSILKNNGFKWASSQGAWQRQLNSNAKYALERVEKALAS